MKKILGSFQFDSLELYGNPNSTNYIYIQATDLLFIIPPQFLEKIAWKPNEKILEGEYLLLVCLEIRNCIQGEIFRPQINAFKKKHKLD